jgi:hypothetical protein
MANTICTIEEAASGILAEIKRVAEEKNIPELAIAIAFGYGMGAPFTKERLDWAEAEMLKAGFA